MAKKVLLSVGVVVLLVGAFFLGYKVGQPKEVKEVNLGSVARANEYHSIRLGTEVTTTQALQTGYATLGSVIFTTSTFGDFSLLNWDGTTSTASTTLVAFANGTPAGTYTFDAVAPNGLYLWSTASTANYFVVTYR